MLGGELQEALLPAHAPGAQPGATVVQDRHGDLEPLAFLSEHVDEPGLDLVEPDGGGHRGADPHLVFVRPVGDASQVAGDGEGGDLPLLLRRVGGGLGEDGEEVGDAAVGDPDLLAVQHIVRSVGRLDCAGADAECVAAGARLGEAEGRDHLAAGELGEPPALLRVGAEEQEALESDRRVRAQRDRDRAVPGGHLLHHARVAGVRETDAAVLLRDDEAEEAQITQGLEQLGGHLARAVEARGVDARHVLAGGLDDLAHGLSRVRVHLRIREELILEDVAEEERLSEARLRVEGHARSVERISGTGE